MKLLHAANRYVQTSTWKTIAALKFCLLSLGVIIGVLLPMIAYEKIDGVETLIGRKVTLAAGVFSLLAVAAYLACYALTRERAVPDQPPRQKPALHMLREAISNRALISIIAASVVMLLAQLTMQNMGGYIFPDYYNNASAQSVSTLVMMGCMLLAAAISKPLATRFGKAEISAAANLFAALVSVMTYVLRPQSVWAFISLQALGWLGLGVFSMVSWALITDVIDHSEIVSGVREDGSIYAMYSFARKLGQAAAAGRKPLCSPPPLPKALLRLPMSLCLRQAAHRSPLTRT